MPTSKMVFRLLGYLGTGLGFLLLIIALMARLYSETWISPTETGKIYPYLDFVIPLAFFGICWVIIGATALSVIYVPSMKDKKQVQVEKPKPQPIQPIIQSIEEKPKSKVRPYKKYIVVTSLVAVIIVALIIILPNVLYKRIDRVIVRVEYSGQWTGSISSYIFVPLPTIISGTGSKDIIVDRPGSGRWTIIVAVSKMDASTETLTVRIMTVDGRELAWGRTTSMFPPAQASYTVGE